jgi:hypothetical protein
LEFVDSPVPLGAVRIELLRDGSPYLAWVELAGLTGPASLSGPPSVGPLAGRFNQSVLLRWWGGLDTRM